MPTDNTLFPNRADSPQLNTPNLPRLSPDDVIIAVMGITGCGKTTFVNHFANKKLKVGHTLDSCTQEVEIAACTLENGKTIYLVDTPGFNDSNRPDTEILRQVSAWLITSHTMRLHLAGIIYLHCIMDNRIGGTGTRNLRMFRRLCGDENLGGVVLATTMWESTDRVKAKEREVQLKKEEKLWAPLIREGSKVLRQDEDKTSGLKIINYLMARKSKLTLDIQTELVDKNLELEQTGAGSELVSLLEKRVQEYQQKIEEINRELETVSGKYLDVKKELEEAKSDWMEGSAKLKAEVKRLEVSQEQIVADERNRHEEQLGQVRGVEARRLRSRYMEDMKSCSVM